MMTLQHHSNGKLNKGLKKSLPGFKLHIIERFYTNSIEVTLLHEPYIININESEMENLTINKQNNVSVLKNEDSRNGDGDQDNVVTWNPSVIKESWWSFCHLPLLAVVFAIIGVLAVSLVVLLWLKNQMIQSEKNKKKLALDSNELRISKNTFPCQSSSFASEKRWICHTVINLKNSEGNGDTSSVSVQQPEKNVLVKNLSDKKEEVKERADVHRIKSKGLLERRGSSASLTIDLPHSSCAGRTHVTPTRECLNEEFLLSAGNVLSRSQLKNCLKNVQNLHQEFWEIPLNHPEKSMVTGCGTKNRYQSILPNEKTRVKLTGNEEHSLDAYINANYIRGYDGEEKAYIATQGPLPNTIQDLYTMAWNENSRIIVMITKLFEKAKVKCESYFPIKMNETAKYGDFHVTVISVQLKEGFSVRELLIEITVVHRPFDKSENELLQGTTTRGLESLELKNNNLINKCEARRILHYWYDTWPDHKTPQNPYGIVAMAREIKNYRENLRRESFNNNYNQICSCGPVIVHCSAGIGRTGCFIAISLAICQLLEEDKVDILGIVCQMRCDRGGMIQTAEQYEFVHRAIVLFEHSLPNSAE